MKLPLCSLCELCALCGSVFARFALTLLLTATVASAQTHFRNITQSAGIRFTHNNGAFGKKYLPETLGPGCAFIDYDDDGFPDILLINGTDFPGHPVHGQTTLKLYHNNRNGTFTDVTAKAGLAVSFYNMGVAIGDYDNDGFDDIFISALGQSHLFHNNRNGTFTDVTKAAGLWGVNEFSTSAAWVDYDNDGKLDLIVGNYVQWTAEGDLFCTLDGTHKSYCTPESYKGASVRVWHNLGAGKFEDATRKSGLYDPTSKTLGIAVLDANGDGWPDLVLANDTQPNKLYVNNRNGTFIERGVTSGIAFSEDGVARAGMGVDAADYDHSGHASIVITNFSNQMISLYHNEGNGLFVDEAPRSEIGRDSLLTLGFGCFFFDYDNDGWPDLFVADGHLDSDIERIQKRITYKQPPHLFHNLSGGKFRDEASAAGADFATPRVMRGAAYADIDNDGRLDLLITTNVGPALLYHNEGAIETMRSGSSPGASVSPANHSVRVKLQGTRSNRDGIGATVMLSSANGKQAQMMRSGSSYLSQSELVLTFGLGPKPAPSSLDVRWPSGQIDKFSGVAADQTITIMEGGKVVARRPYRNEREAAPRRQRAMSTPSAMSAAPTVGAPSR